MCYRSCGAFYVIKIKINICYYYLVIKSYFSAYLVILGVCKIVKKLSVIKNFMITKNDVKNHEENKIQILFLIFKHIQI